MDRYLSPATDPHELVFKDYPKAQHPSELQYGRDLFRNPVECHVCYGHGGWNLALDQYRMPVGVPEERRGRYIHFRRACNQCWSWGYVEAGSPDDTCPRHEWSEQTIGNCLHRWTCKHCGVERAVDSSG